MIQLGEDVMFAQVPSFVDRTYYDKAFEWRGLYVTVDASVSDDAVLVAAETFFNMLRYRSDIVTRLVENQARVAIAPIGGVAVDLPEFAAFRGTFTLDGRSYDDVIGLGGVIGNPVSSTNVDNVLKLPSDEYRGLQNILLHEAAHLIENVGFDGVLRQQLTTAYDAAMRAGLWRGTYAASNEDEYFAVLTEVFFGHERQPDASFNAINTRAELATYDPVGFALLTAVYGNDAWNDGDWAGTSQNDNIVGSNVGDFMSGRAGNDDFTGRGGNDTLVGGGGLDEAHYSGSVTNYTVRLQSSGVWTLQDNRPAGDGTDTFSEVERLRFSDAVLAFDLEGAAGQTYRLYEAAFDRTPDLYGLSWNVNLIDRGMSLRAMAEAFAFSPEFVALYGANSSNEVFVRALYNNVLEREPEQAGLTGWLAELAAGRSRGDVLIGFSESSENKSVVGATIQNGILLDASFIL